MKLKFNEIEMDISWSKVYNYVYAKGNAFLSMFADWRDKQANWRLKRVKQYSPICIDKGYCIHCGCEWKDKKHYELEPCTNQCYPRWLTFEEWQIIESLQHIEDKKILEEIEQDFINFIHKKDNINGKGSKDGN